MINKEEKKAIDKLKRSANYFVMPIYETSIILNLISKLQKENESLKIQLDGVIALKDEYKKEVKTKGKAIDLMASMIDNYDSQLEICQFKDKEDVERFVFEKVEVQDD